MALARISRAERVQLQKLIRAANAKTRRNIKRGVDSALLITPPTLSDVTKLDRKGVNAVKTQLQRYVNRNVQQYQFIKTDDGGYITKRTAFEIKSAQRRVNSKISAAEKKYDDERYNTVGDVADDELTVGDVRRQIKGSHPRYSKRTTSFENELEAIDYLKRIKEYDADWISIKNLIYQENLALSIVEAYGDDALDILNVIEHMDADKLAFLAATNEALTIEYQYSWAERQESMAKIRSVLGISD